MQNFNDDYQALVNSLERHTKCSTAYCLQNKPGQEPTCRFKFPKDCQEETSLDFQLVRKAGSDDHERQLKKSPKLEVKQPRLLTSHNRVMLQHWIAIVDLQAIVDTD